MTNRVIAFVCLLGVSGALGQAAQDFAQQTSDYYRGKREHLEGGHSHHYDHIRNSLIAEIRSTWVVTDMVKAIFKPAWQQP